MCFNVHFTFLCSYRTASTCGDATARLWRVVPALADAKERTDATLFASLGSFNDKRAALPVTLQLRESWRPARRAVLVSVMVPVLFLVSLC